MGNLDNILTTNPAVFQIVDFFESLLVLFLFIILVFGQQPKNVFVVIIDGLRNDEAFESESLYLRHIWNDLRPLGTIYKRFWNRGWTATTSGHTTIASGVRLLAPNTGNTAQDIRANHPTFFEYFRKTFALPESAAGGLHGKTNNRCTDYSLEPSYGEAYKGFIRYGADDTTVSQWVHRTMDSIHSQLLYINLREVDSKGHSGNYQDYLQAIMIADSLIYEFWKHIQALPPHTDTFYKNKTVMIVTTDHGRNDDAHGGFEDHGKWNHGCRDLFFLAIGPGIRQNTVITNIDRDHIDIAPTVGYILGFPTPFSEGEVMREIFTSDFKSPLDCQSLKWDWEGGFDENLSNTPGFSREPDIAVDRNGRVHVVWVDNTRGKWEIYYWIQPDW